MKLGVMALELIKTVKINKVKIGMLLALG